MTSWTLSGGTLLLEEGLIPGESLHLVDGLVSRRPACNARKIDASGLLVLPGIVDLHGDAHERQFQPRPGVAMPSRMALLDSETQILAAGITTAFLGVTLSWEPGLRSAAAWRSLLAALTEIRPELQADLKVHLRFEVDNLDCVDEAVSAIEAREVDLLAFNDHTPGILQKLAADGQAAKYAERAGVPAAVLRDMAMRVASRRDEVPEARLRLSAAARIAGVPMASHDDATEADRRMHRALGASICEFPMSEAVAMEAQSEGEAIVMGAPNVVRGGSHLGWASAAPLAERGLVTVLASDYVWPTLLQAAFVLIDRGRLGLPEAWALISKNPAQAAGLTDRGTLAVGRRGDVVLVDPRRRRATATFCGGELSWLAPGDIGRVAAR